MDTKFRNVMFVITLIIVLSAFGLDNAENQDISGDSKWAMARPNPATLDPTCTIEFSAQCSMGQMSTCTMQCGCDASGLILKCNSDGSYYYCQCNYS